MFSTTTQYALRALLILAERSNGTLVLGRDIAQRALIPANYLSKVMLTLAGAGIVEGSRGSNGGYRLVIPAHDLKLLSVVRLFDRQFAPKACVLGLKKECSDAAPCPAHVAWQDAKAGLMKFLEETSLDDISGGAFEVMLPKQRQPPA